MNKPKVAPAELQSIIDRNVETISRIEKAAMSAGSPSDKVADRIAEFCGSVRFVWVHCVWFGLWISVNTLPFVPKARRFDPAPFPNLTLAVSLEAIFLSTFILISQNRQQLISDRRNHLDLQINLLAEQEASLMLTLIKRISDHLNIDTPDADVETLRQATDPEMVVKELERQS